MTKDDSEVINALKRSVCCPCNSARMLVIGILLGALVVWLSTIAGLYIAKQLAVAAEAPEPVTAPALSCPAPVIDVDRLASICMDFHNKPKAKAK